MTFLENPFFWALISMFGLVGACTVVGSSRIGHNSTSGFLIVSTFVMGRLVLVLPFCQQPRFDGGAVQSLFGGVFFVIGLFFALGPCAAIKPFNVAEKRMELVSSGFYTLTRNPIYFGELLWTLGWAMLFRSAIGVVLVPLWWAGFLFLITLEEESLEQALGQSYLEYKQRVRGRILPGLPV